MPCLGWCVMSLVCIREFFVVCMDVWEHALFLQPLHCPRVVFGGSAEEMWEQPFSAQCKHSHTSPTCLPNPFYPNPLIYEGSCPVYFPSCQFPLGVEPHTQSWEGQVFPWGAGDHSGVRLRGGDRLVKRPLIWQGKSYGVIYPLLTSWPYPPQTTAKHPHAKHPHTKHPHPHPSASLWDNCASYGFFQIRGCTEILIATFILVNLFD